MTQTERLSRLAAVSSWLLDRTFAAPDNLFHQYRARAMYYRLMCERPNLRRRVRHVVRQLSYRFGRRATALAHRCLQAPVG
jgi:hypothetical protein